LTNAQCRALGIPERRPEYEDVVTEDIEPEE
jgi:hypothetical protein